MKTMRLLYKYSDGSSEFTFNCSWKQIKSALHPLFLKSTFAFVFRRWKYIFTFHIITEELSQHVRSDQAFSSQNLKFAGQISDDRLPLEIASVSAGDDEAGYSKSIFSPNVASSSTRGPFFVGTCPAMSLCFLSLNFSSYFSVELIFGAGLRGLLSQLYPFMYKVGVEHSYRFCKLEQNDLNWPSYLL